MNPLFKNLPMDLVYIILSYDGNIIKERNGKYMKQILKTDERYKLLLTIPKKDVSVHKNIITVYIQFSDKIFNLWVTEYEDTISYRLYKSGYPLKGDYRCR